MAEGTQVGAQRVLRQIGEGGKGSVWLAEHLALERRAALKMRPPECSNRAAIVTRSFNEARATTAIADPGAAGEIGDTVPSGLQRHHPGPGCAPLIRCSRA
jgi:serine/threonine protein kinase